METVHLLSGCKTEKKKRDFIMQCAYCGEYFHTDNPIEKFCSGLCVRKKYSVDYESQCQATEKRLKKTPKTPKPKIRLVKTCQVCGAVFETYRPSQKFCQLSCSQVSTTITDRRRRWVIFERDNFRCIYCGRSSTKDGVVLHVDHIVPRHSGGEDRAKNLVTACKICNLSKNKTLLSNQEEILEIVADRNNAKGISPEMLIYRCEFDQ